jgi:flagellar export protein FliJ
MEGCDGQQRGTAAQADLFSGMERGDMSGMEPKTRLDRLVQVRERGEDTALENLARAQSSLGRAAERLAGMRQAARSDARDRGAAELWVVEEAAHVRALSDVRSAERELAQALQRERAARDGFALARRDAEVARRVQEKKRAEIRDDRERREVRAFDDLATMGFNSRVGT